MARGRRFLGQVVLVLAVTAGAFVGAKLGMLGTRDAGASHNFSDVPDSAFFHDFVQFLVDNGITSGCSVAPPLYCGEQPVTRGQMAVFLQRLAALTCLRREGTDVIFEGCNVHIRSGAGATDAAVNGLGNLIIGYNEATSLPTPPNVRTGSHNLVVGPFHTYSSFGGFVAGQNNAVSGSSASVSGGSGHTASGRLSSVSGGTNNRATEFAASVSGGTGHTASGLFASVSGGAGNTAGGQSASVSGGAGNTASNLAASVSGGADNTANGARASVSGGAGNTASNDEASVSGGAANVANGIRASVSGGQSNTASNLAASVSGGGGNLAGGNLSSVSGGQNRSAPGDFDWAAGGLFQNF
jgi:hypothetical protein